MFFRDVWTNCERRFTQRNGAGILTRFMVSGTNASTEAKIQTVNNPTECITINIERLFNRHNPGFLASRMTENFPIRTASGKPKLSH